MTVEAQVEEADISKVRTGQKALVTFDAFPGLSMTGTVVKTGNTAIPDFMGGAQRFATTLALPSGPSDLKPGVTAKCEIGIEEKTGVLLIPISAVFARGSRSFVYLPGRPPQFREVVLGACSDTHAEVKEGLSEGEKILLYEPENAAPLPTPAENGPAVPFVAPSEKEGEGTPVEGMPPGIPPDLLQKLPPDFLNKVPPGFLQGLTPEIIKDLQGKNPEELKKMLEQGVMPDAPPPEVLPPGKATKPLP
jgi:hypothetical protein